MHDARGFNDKRQFLRVESEFSVRISIGSQFTLDGRLKDLSPRGAFIIIKNSIFIKTGDEVGIEIQLGNEEDSIITAKARLSRIVPGEGFAVYFTDLKDANLAKLKKIC